MKRHGVGTYKSGDNEYVGDWKDDAMDGQGKFTFASGAVYEVSLLALLAPQSSLASPVALTLDRLCRARGQTTSSWERASTTGLMGRPTPVAGLTTSTHPRCRLRQLTARSLPTN
jgi:hypothetical protein